MMRISCGCVLLGIAALATPLGSGEAVADVLARESFDGYARGSLAGGSDGAGWGGPWDVRGTANVRPNRTTVEGVPCFGHCVVLDQNSRASRVLDVRPDGAFDRAGLVEAGRIGKRGGVLYVGFMQRVSTVPVVTPGTPAYLRFYSFELNTGPSDHARVLEIGHDDRSNRPHGPYYGAASVANNGRDDREPGQFRSLGTPDTEANVIVVKLTFGPDDCDVVEIFRNPESQTDESASTVDARLEGDFAFDRVALARFVGNEPVHEVDEIRFGTEYADVFAPVDEERIEQLAAQARQKIEGEAEALRRRIDALEARGVDTTGWRAQADRIWASARDGSPWQGLGALERLDESIALSESGLVVPKLLFVKRPMFQPTHVYTEFSDGPFRPGGGIFVLSPARPDGQVTRIFDAAGGIVRDPEVSFDGRRVLFSYRPGEDDYYHVYEMSVDGSGLRRITDGPFHDLDPFYLPDGRIGMTSTRAKSRALCFWVRAATLFVMHADGTEIRPLTSNNVNEFTPQMLPDGRILYTRWEYMDKSAIFVQSLWSTLPDGTRAQQIFGNNLIHPVSLLQARLIRGTKKIACILGAHNGDSVGPLVVVDPTVGMNSPDAILNLTPECNYHSGCFAPFPLDERWCLVSYGPQEPFGIYAFRIDPPPESIVPRKTEVALQSPQHPSNLGEYWASFTGGRHLVYRDDTYSCVEAMPLVPRPVPAEAGSPLESDEPQDDGQDAFGEGTLVLVDVYRGLEGAVPRGTIHSLRIVEEMGHRDERGRRDYEGAFDADEFQRQYGAGFMSLYAAPWESGKPAPSLQAKYVYGTVPVEPDGSAHFRVPAERPVYFQALDAGYNEIQRMRSYLHLKPGETQSCIGCHEHRFTSPPASTAELPMALRRGPSSIEPPPFGAGPFSYVKLVQPILDRRCASCHATEEPAGGVNLSCRPDGRGVPISFASLVRPRTDPDRPPLVHFFDNWWGVSTTVPVAEPLSFGTSASRLLEMIDTRHEGVDMPDADRARIRLAPLERRVLTTWIDLNCPLWDNYDPERHVCADGE